MPQFKFDPSKLNPTEIKISLRKHFEDSGVFNDYDFEGSGLSALLDVLAYNTHYNALIANFATNEAFLDTAQIRGSVVSHAKPLDYLPRSKRAAKARVRLTLGSVPSFTPDIVIPKYTKITANVDNEVYTFYTLDEYTATNGNNYTVEVDVFEGKLLNKRFIVDADTSDYPIYVIPTKDMDTSTMEVVVSQGINSMASESYSLPKTVGQLTPDNRNYFLFESPNGYYELMLGDGRIGFKPPSGSVIDVRYLKTNGPEVNGARTFFTSAKAGGFNISVSTVAKASGGAIRESVESIKFNAPKTFASQNRLVTTDDYRALLQKEVPYLETLNVWGGEDNVPPEYGTVFVSIKPVGAEKLTETQTVQIKELIVDPRKILTIQTRFVDPEFQYLEVRMDVRYDQSSTSLTQSQIQNAVKESILDYAEVNLAAFESSFRKSRLLSFIDDSSDAILNVNAEVWMQRRLFPILGQRARYDLPFTTPFANVTSAPRVFVSDPFEYTVDGVTYRCTLRNRTNSTQLEIVRQGSNGDIIVVDNAGFLDTSRNIATLLPFQPSGLINASEGIRFSAKPADDNVVFPKRNLLIRIDERNTAVSAVKET